MQDFRKLRVWQHAKDFSVSVHRVTRGFPPDERFGISAQIRRSAQSVCANLAEGCGYRGGADSARFFQIAFGSACETLNHLIISFELGYLDATTFEDLEKQLLSIRKMLFRLLQRVRREAE
jgi:four helix bundle protein